MDDLALQDALTVLGDVSAERLTAARWEVAEQHIAAMEAAVASDDSEGLIRAVRGLERVSSTRATPLGAPLPTGTPRPLRTRLNRLVHSLGEIPSDYHWAEPVNPRGDGPSAKALDEVGDRIGVSGRDLVVHVFAPLDGPAADDAYRELLDLWAAGRRSCASTDAVPRLGLPIELPPELAVLPVGPAIAAQQNRGGDVQMILRREHDALVLSVLWAGASHDNAARWAAAGRMWTEISADRTAAALGVAQLYLGTSTAAPAGDAARLAAVDGEPWQPIAGFAACDLPPRSDTRPGRRLVVLADAGRDPDLSAWAWARPDASLPPLAHYLLNAAKLRYEIRVWSQAKRAAATAEIEAEVDPDELAVRITHLRDMRLTVDIARGNMATATAMAMASTSTGAAGIPADDGSLADWFCQQLDDDVAYLENTRARALVARPAGADGHRTGHAPTIGLVTALPEEYAAMLSLIDDPAAAPVPTGDDGADYVRGTMPSAVSDVPHDVVLTLLGETGTVAASNAVGQLIRSFPSVAQVVMVGIAAGVPAPRHPERHVRLGDIVVATWGIVDFDHIVDRSEGPTLRQGFPRPSPALAYGAKMLVVGEKFDQRPWDAHVDTLVRRLPAFARPDAATDVLFSDDTPDAVPIPHPDPAASGHIPGRAKVHHGRIGSSERSLRNAEARDKLAETYQMRAIEMEGTGIGRAAFAHGREWFVVRGISDYGDARTNTTWRDHASAVAAAYVRALLAKCAPIRR